MKEDDLNFPVLCFARNSIRVREDSDSLTRTTRAGIKNGMFNDMIIVDSAEIAIRIKTANKLHGLGQFFGWNIFSNQTIRVSLEAEGKPYHIPIDEVKNMICKSFTSWHGWSTRGDFEQLKASVLTARTVKELAALLK